MKHLHTTIRGFLFAVLMLVTSCASVAIMSGGAAFGQTALPIPFFKPQFFDNSGNPLASGKLYTCSAGSTCPGTPLATYTDSGGGTANANPIILDSAGRANIWLTGGSSYKFVLQTSASAAVWTYDNIQGSAIAVIASGTVNRSVKYTSATTVGDGSIQDLYSGERVRIQADGTVSIGTTTDSATGLHVLTAVGEAGRFGTTTGTPSITMYGSSGGIQTLAGQFVAIAATGEFDMCSAAGPCNTGFGVFPTYTTSFNVNEYGLRVVGTAGTSGVSMWTSSTYRGGLTANATNISLCSGTGPCASYVQVAGDAIGVIGTSSSVFNVVTSDATSVRQQWNYATSSTAGSILGNSTGLVLTGASAIDLVGTSTNVLDIITSNATNVTRFYASTGTLVGQVGANSTEFDLCSSTGPCSGGIGILNSGNRVNIFGGGSGTGLRVGNDASNNVCIWINGGLRQLALSGANIVDNGACPF